MLQGKCFPAGTLVSAEHGPAPIETLAVGDLVWAYDPVELVLSLKPVLAKVTPHYHGKLITLDLGEEQLQVTTSHPFWVVTGDDLVSRPRPAHVDDLSAPSQTTGRWVDSEHLRPGDFLLTKSGTVLRLESVAIRDVAGLPVYNFTVGDLHCYAVMNCEVLVHNTEDCPPKNVNGVAGAAQQIPSVQGGKFNDWFNELSHDDLVKLWADSNSRKKIEQRLRSPGGFHEWLPVSRTPVFKKWGITAEEIRRMRTATSDVMFKNGRHGGEFSGTAHQQLFRLIDESSNFESYVAKLQNWANNNLLGGASSLPEGLRP